MSSETVKNTMISLAVAPFIFLWVFGGLIGAIIEAVQKDLLGVVPAIFIPGYGAIITVLALFHAVF